VIGNYQKNDLKMNIDKLIFPFYNRFKTLNVGVKRLLFLLTFPVMIIIVLIGIAGIGNDRIYLLILLGPMLYMLFWILVRACLWVFDGFIQNGSGN